MAYVDLNPVRAGMARTPERSDYSSVQQRARKLAGSQCAKQPVLLPMVDAETVDADDDHTLCPSRLMDYLELVDCTGRAVRDDKRGSISGQAMRILDRLGIDEKVWLSHMRRRKQRHTVAVGALARLREYAQETGRKWVAGQSPAGW